MNNYIIYTNEYSNEVIVERFNDDNGEELLNIQKSLLKEGYVILMVQGYFIKCSRVLNEEEMHE